jgi:hypothetical protein
MILLLDSLLLGLANRFAGRADEYRYRRGTHLPRVLDSLAHPPEGVMR